MNQDLLEFNFWPSFADLMLSLVLVMVLLLSIIVAALAAGVDIEPIKQKQSVMIQELADACSVTPDTSGADIILSLTPKHQEDISIHNELDKQLLKFSDYVLFPQDVATLGAKGRGLLTVVGAIIKAQNPSIKEIQIQGHADPARSIKFQSNLDLAAARAIAVYKFLQDSVGIDPASCLMSVTSFGEYKPIGRTPEDTAYSATKLFEANRTSALKSKNRRIEILLFYRNS